MPTIRDLATELSQAFVDAKRADGSDFRKLRDDSPQWMVDVIHAAHRTGPGNFDVMLPDDHRYEFAETAVNALAECEADAPSEAIDAIEADIYTHLLTRWLASRTDRYAYCDQYAEDFGVEEFPGMIEMLQGGQRIEREEVFNLVLDALRDLADGAEVAENDEDAA